MNDLAREQLCKILARYGHTLCEHPRRIRAFLSDYCPDLKREVPTLLALALITTVLAGVMLASQFLFRRAEEKTTGWRPRGASPQQSKPVGLRPQPEHDQVNI